MFNTILLMMCFQLDTFCFDQRSYVVLEDGGPLLMSMSLSRALPFDILVRFIYRDLTAFGKL